MPTCMTYTAVSDAITALLKSTAFSHVDEIVDIGKWTMDMPSWDRESFNKHFRLCLRDNVRHWLKICPRRGC